MGIFVRHPGFPSWGTGEVLEQGDHTVRVIFSEAGEKHLDTRYVTLVEVEGGQGGSTAPRVLKVLPNLDKTRVRTACTHFYEEMKDNRPNCNDGSLGLNVLRDIEQTGDLSRATMRQLVAWCTTNGTVYQRGVALAQQISLAVYGRILGPEDL